VENSLFLKTVGNIFRLLELVAEAKGGYTLTELTKLLDISMGAAQRLTNTLVTLNYLYKEPKTKNYRLTPKIFKFGFAFINRSEIREIASPYLIRLNEELNEIVNLGVMNDEEIVYIDRIDKTSHGLTTNLRVGSRVPINLSSIGKAIMAFLPESDQRRILDHLYSPQYKGKIPINKDQLLKQFQEIRRNRYSVNQNDLFQDISGVATPILNYQGLPVAGISIVIPRTFPRSHIKQKYAPTLIEMGKKISMELGHLKEGGLFNRDTI
jgi:IclR family transcriptional regulator, KDG regulon repressor